MQIGSFKLWLARGFRLSLVVGVVTAVWQSWTVFSNYNAEQRSWAKTRLLYECAADLNNDVLKEQVTEFGTVNMKGLCAFDNEDHWVSLSEIADVRNGRMKFETLSKPYNIELTASAGLFGFLSTVFATLAVLSAIRLAHWIWGRT